MTETKAVRIPVLEAAARALTISREEAAEFRRKQEETTRRVEQLEHRVEQTARRLDELATGEQRFDPSRLRDSAGPGGFSVRGDQRPDA